MNDGSAGFCIRKVIKEGVIVLGVKIALVPLTRHWQ